MPILIPVSPGPLCPRTEFLADEAFAIQLASVLWHAPSSPSGPPRSYVRSPDGRQKQLYAQRLVWWLAELQSPPPILTRGLLLQHILDMVGRPRIVTADGDMYNVQLANLRMAGVGFGLWKPVPVEDPAGPDPEPGPLALGQPQVELAEPTPSEIEDIFKLK